MKILIRRLGGELIVNSDYPTDDEVIFIDFDDDSIPVSQMMYKYHCPVSNVIREMVKLKIDASPKCMYHVNEIWDVYNYQDRDYLVRRLHALAKDVSGAASQTIQQAADIIEQEHK